VPKASRLHFSLWMCLQNASALKNRSVSETYTFDLSTAHSVFEHKFFRTDYATEGGLGLKWGDGLVRILLRYRPETFSNVRRTRTDLQLRSICLSICYMNLYCCLTVFGTDRHCKRWC